MAQIIDDKKISPLLVLIKAEPELVSFLKEGDVVEAKLISRTIGAAYFDLGKFGTGTVSGTELINAKEIIKNLKSGDKINSKVIEVENKEGFVELSLAGAHKQKEWQIFKDSMESGEVLSVKIIGANSGGLIAKINEIKAFLPVSQLNSEHYPKVEINEKNAILNELKKLVGGDLKVKIIDVNPRADKLIISERAAAEEDIKKLLEKYKVGDSVNCVISGVTNFGAFARFIDEPTIEGMIHISELDYRLIGHPKEIVSINDEIKAKIVEIKDSQVFLSLKALKSDPWEKAEEKFKQGETVNGKVFNFNPFGAIIDLGSGLQGLIHSAEFGGLEEMKKQLEIGKEYQFIIDSVKPQEKRINLKFKK